MWETTFMEGKLFLCCKRKSNYYTKYEGKALFSIYECGPFVQVRLRSYIGKAKVIF